MLGLFNFAVDTCLQSFFQFQLTFSSFLFDFAVN